MHPKIVVPAIAAARRDLLEMQAHHVELAARLKPGQAILSFNPHVQDAGGTQDLPEAASLEFWKIEGEEPFSVFMEGLGIHLDMLDLPAARYEELPVGYGIARFVLRFETHCKFSAWLAVRNVGRQDMVRTREYYRRAGMPEEAEALARAEAAWYAAGGHDGTGYDAAGDAYASVANPDSDEDERWFKLLEFLRRAELWV